MLVSKEVEKWYVADLNKMINWKEVKADGATPVRKKDLLVVWNLVCGRPEPTRPKHSKEDMDMDGGVNSEFDVNLCEGNEQHQVTSILV